MPGLILLAAVAVFVALLVWLSGLLIRWLRVPQEWRFTVRVLIVLGAFPLMVADEIIGKFQFEALCQANGIESIDTSSIKQRHIKIHDDYFSWTLMPGGIIPIEETTTRIKDASTDQVVAIFKNYRTAGGWLIRYTPLNMGSPQPMLFDGTTCNWNSISEILNQNNVVILKR